MSRKLCRFLTLPFREKILFLEAFLLHLWVGLLLKVIPFRWIPRLFSSRQFDAPTKEEDQSRSRSVGTSVHSRHSSFAEASADKVGSQQFTPNTSRLKPHVLLLYQIKTATQRASKVSPWRNKCLVSSLAGRCMLRRRKIASQLSLGVVKNPSVRTIGHAWLRSGDIEIVSSVEGFQELYQF